MVVFKLKLFRKFLLVGLFLCGSFILFSLVSRSKSRSSILGPTSVFSGGAVPSAGEAAEQAPSKIHLQEFHRVEVKDGVPIWEVKAEEAKHFPEENLIHVNKAYLKIYRKGESPVEISSKAARLFADATSLKTAVLEGDISVKIDTSLEVDAQLATFDVSSQLITAPDSVKVRGPGYEIEGDGMKFLVDKRQFELARNVRSRFEQNQRGSSLANSLPH